MRHNTIHSSLSFWSHQSLSVKYTQRFQWGLHCPISIEMKVNPLGLDILKWEQMKTRTSPDCRHRSNSYKLCWKDIVLGAFGKSLLRCWSLGNVLGMISLYQLVRLRVFLHNYLANPENESETPLGGPDPQIENKLSQIHCSSWQCSGWQFTTTFSNDGWRWYMLWWIFFVTRIKRQLPDTGEHAVWRGYNVIKPIFRLYLVTTERILLVFYVLIAYCHYDGFFFY